MRLVSEDEQITGKHRNEEMTETEDVQLLVYDNGIRMAKTRFAGNDALRVMFPSIAGMPSHMISSVLTLMGVT